MSCENFQTLLTQIESMLNSRPLTPISNDSNDFTALTPGHFLIGRPMNIRPVLNKNFKPKPATFKGFQEMERRSKRKWKEWYRSYLTTLQKRNKWTNDGDEAIKVGDLVLVAEDNVQAFIGFSDVSRKYSKATMAVLEWSKFEHKLGGKSTYCEASSPSFHSANILMICPND